MNKITKRIVAGASALAMLVSAVGVEQFADLFMKTSYAEGYVGKTAQSTGFSNLEQDTTKGNAAYNTGYGLHTNKTVTNVGDDGRTFDVNLESWYVGENPVDVATILDASGSMAWTVDTLDPLKVDEQLDATDKLYLNTKYTTEDLTEIQKANGGYLPQDVVDRILDPTKTDNTKLSYADYKYYVYEARSSVSEFVPLGYWDGGIDPKNDESLIGYYPFSGDLKNKAPKATDGATGMLINHPTGSESTYNTSEKAAETLKAEFSTQEVTEKVDGKTVTKTVVKGLNIADSSSKGAVLVESPTTNKFSISFELSVDNSDKADSNNKEYDEATILYLTDGTNYYRIFRGGAGSAARLKISTNKSQLLNANSAVNTEPREWKFTFDFDSEELTIYTKTKNVKWTDGDSSKNGNETYTVSLAGYSLIKDNLKVYIGGNTKEYKNPNDIYIKNLTVNNFIDGEETPVATYPLQTKDDGLKNTVDGSSDAIFVEQAYNNDGKFGTEKIGTHLLNPVFRNDKALDVKKTSQNGAVSLDAVPTLDDGFTISMKLYRTASIKDNQQNIFYLGDKNTSQDYYQYFRSKTAGGYLGLSKNNKDDFKNSPPNDTDKVYYQGGMKDGSEKNENWYTNTLVFKTNPENDKEYIITPYINGKAEYQSDAHNFTIDKISVDEANLVFLLCALNINSNDSEQYLDDLYVFNNALDAEVVNAYFGDNTVSCKVDGATHALSYVKDEEGNFVKDDDGNLKTIEIAQISNDNKRLGKNTSIDQRRGWYYVNSASAWKDIAGCLASGKQYIGIFTDEGLTGSFSDMANDIATEPAGYAEGNGYLTSIKAGNNEHNNYEAPTTERSIRFYVDDQNHLRCFVWSGDTTKNKDNKRTFCSVVYEKKDEQKTKYEELNSALNTFYRNLAKNSDLSNTSVVRFSTNNAVDEKNTDTTDTNLKKLIMKDWTNWSDAYLKEKIADKTKYLQDLLIPETNETATDTTPSTARSDDISEYPYVMTGGTYTWTGLKAFYDNMVKKDGLESGNRVYDVANDARDKYLIIFTDGRDNTQDYDVITNEGSKELGDILTGSPDYTTGSNFKETNYVDKYNPYKGEDHKVGFSIGYYSENNWGGSVNTEYLVQQFKTGVHEIATDGDLAQAWADKIKEEGYTIYCVMLATGSISESTNKDEYNKAYNFLRSLAGGGDDIKEMEDLINYHLNNNTKPDEIARYQKQLEELKKDHVIVVDPSKDGGMTVTDAFQKILDDIQKPREDYTVQDYIDPRFNLIGKGFTRTQKDGSYTYDAIDVIYHLGANGKVTFTDTNNQPIESDDNYVYFDNGSYKTGYLKDGETAGNIIDKSSANGLLYTPLESYMVNRRETTDTSFKDGYDTGDGKGTGYLYYDNVKDMYYLRWEDQVIPMEDKTFDTKEPDNKKLDVWSATIRLKAKDDFIGGNNILTNGNEAGENLVYSDATIENIDKNPELYFTADELEKYTTASGKVSIPYRQKLEVLSGTDRKINAVDAGGVSQAVYGDGIDIPSSGFPRTTVNVRLLKLDAKNLNDVIYMGEVVSPTMMLADLENDYMTGSYYLEYLERYAYRLYGKNTDKTPLLDLLNEWLKIDNKDEMSKTFTIPYIYLPDPIYNNGKLQVDRTTNRVMVSNNTGASWDTSDNTNFDDLNLRDVTGFITYTWKREYNEGEEKEPQQKVEGTDEYDITLDYIVKNTNQIKYNLQLKFTPLHEEALDGFDINDEKFITGTIGTVDDKFFNIDTTLDESSETYYEFVDSAENKWVFTNRSDYLKAMISETQTYTPHVEYNKDSGKWQLITSTEALVEKTDKGVYDWDKEYKPVKGDEQIESDQTYTNTPDNVKVEGFSLVANTTYTKDVVNAALALEIYVDGKYLQSNMPITKRDTFTFEATRYYDDPLDPLPYGADINADTVDGKKYQLTFKVDKETLPASAVSSEIYRLWATLTKVEVDDGTGNYVKINEPATDTNQYIGYTVENALPIGTYEISVSDTDMESMAETSQYYLGIADRETAPGHFQYLKIENDVKSYTYDRFPDKVVSASADAVKDTGDKEYQIQNGTTDYSKANIAENNREKAADKQTVTFYFGTVAEKEVSEDTTLHNIKGVSVKEYLKEHPEDTKLSGFTDDYAKDRLGIIMLSASANSLAITKEVTRTNDSTESYKNQDWDFTVTVKTSDTEWITSHESSKSIDYTLYNLDGEAWKADTTKYKESFETSGPDDDGMYTLTVNIKVKHNQKVVLNSLPEGTWQVKEVEKTDVLYTPHNDQFIYGEDEWQYKNAAETRTDIELSPASQVNYVNEFPHELPSTGDSGIVRLIILGTMFTLCSVMLFAIPWYNCRKCRTMKK